jgi:hypothetical protein
MGDSIGYVDICQKDSGTVQQDWFASAEQLTRKFTTRCVTYMEILELDISVLGENM